MAMHRKNISMFLHGISSLSSMTPPKNAHAIACSVINNPVFQTLNEICAAAVSDARAWVDLIDKKAYACVLCYDKKELIAALDANEIEPTDRNVRLLAAVLRRAAMKPETKQKLASRMITELVARKKLKPSNPGSARWK